MKFKHKNVDFRISRRTLWVDMQAYPLHNVTRVQPIELKINHRAVWKEYGTKAGKWIAFAILGLFVLVGLGSSLPLEVHLAYWLVILGPLAVHTTRLVRRLAFRRLHVLSVATSGNPHAALISRDKELIHDLTLRVVDAIDNPAVEYAIKVEHIETVYGDKIGGDKVDGDKVDGHKIVSEG